MERLTVNCDGQWVPRGLCSFDRDGNVDLCDACPGSNGHCEGECSECPVQACFDSLAAYEATGMTPGRIKEIDALYAEKCREVAEMKKRLEEPGAGEGQDG